MMWPDLTPRARRELADLLSTQGPGRVEALLTAHQRRDVEGCLCGWSELGKSHAGHQASVLREIGLPIGGVWLQKSTGHNGNEIRVLAEVDGVWRVVITEVADDGPISHIVEPAGIERAPVWSDRA